MNYKPIKSIKRVCRKVEVFNFDVPGQENYIANGFVVHNCQNFTVSQSLPDERGKHYDPSALIDLALRRGVAGIAFTYNEPTLYYEYIKDVGHEIHRFGHPLKLVLKSSGFVNKSVLRDLCLYVDGFNIDLKGDTEDYKSICGGSLGPVLESIELIVRMQRHLEVSYLVLPSRVYDSDLHASMRAWIASIGCNIPFHLLYFYPFHEMADEKVYPVDELERLHRFFSRKLKHVYISNRYDRLIKYRHTRCSICGEILISRTHPARLIKHSCCRKRILGIFS